MWMMRTRLENKDDSEEDEDRNPEAENEIGANKQNSGVNSASDC